MRRILFIAIVLVAVLMPVRADNSTNESGNVSLNASNFQELFSAALANSNLYGTKYAACQDSLAGLYSNYTDAKIELVQAQEKAASLPVVNAQLDGVIANLTFCNGELLGLNTSYKTLNAKYLAVIKERDDYRTKLDGSYPKWYAYAGVFIGLIAMHFLTKKPAPKLSIGKMGQVSPYPRA